jgi:hypothetical protein
LLIRFNDDDSRTTEREQYGRGLRRCNRNADRTSGGATHLIGHLARRAKQARHTTHVKYDHGTDHFEAWRKHLRHCD